MKAASVSFFHEIIKNLYKLAVHHLNKYVIQSRQLTKEAWMKLFYGLKSATEPARWQTFEARNEKIVQCSERLISK